MSENIDRCVISCERFIKNLKNCFSNNIILFVINILPYLDFVIEQEHRMAACDSNKYLRFDISI